MSADDEDHARDTALELALRSGLHTPAALTLDEQPATPLRRENAFCVDSGAPSAKTSRAQSTQSAAVRSDAATLFGEELKEISSAHKKQCEQLALMRLAHVKQWLEQMESTLLRLEKAYTQAPKNKHLLDRHKFQPHLYLSPNIMARLDLHVAAMSEAAMRSVTTVALATTLLDECARKEITANTALEAALNSVKEAYLRTSRLVDFCAKNVQHRMSKRELEDAAASYYAFLGHLGSINTAMEQMYTVQQHMPCFSDIMSQLLRADLLRRVLDGDDHRNEDAEESNDDEEEDEDDGSEEASQ